MKRAQERKLKSIREDIVGIYSELETQWGEEARPLLDDLRVALTALRRVQQIIRTGCEFEIGERTNKGFVMCSLPQAEPEPRYGVIPRSTVQEAAACALPECVWFNESELERVV